MRGLVLLLGLVALPARAQDHAVMGGADIGMGIFGVSYLRHVEGDPVGFAVGGGVAGFGARVQRRLSEQYEDFGYQTRYLSAGVSVLPWSVDPVINTRAVLVVEYGAEVVFRPVYFSAAIGGFIPLDGNVSGNYLGPSGRLTVGVSY